MDFITASKRAFELAIHALTFITQDAYNEWPSDNSVVGQLTTRIITAGITQSSKYCSGKTCHT